jgi:hypothetical protein
MGERIECKGCGFRLGWVPEQYGWVCVGCGALLVLNPDYEHLQEVAEASLKTRLVPLNERDPKAASEAIQARRAFAKAFTEEVCLSLVIQAKEARR